MYRFQRTRKLFAAINKREFNRRKTVLWDFRRDEDISVIQTMKTHFKFGILKRSFRESKRRRSEEEKKSGNRNLNFNVKGSFKTQPSWLLAFESL